MKTELRAGGQVVALLIDVKNAPEGTHPMTEPEGELQMLVGKQPAGYIVKKHSHKKMERVSSRRQKAVVVLSGAIVATVCDEAGVDGDSCVIEAGQCLLLLQGGYHLEMKERSFFFEFKNGPHVEDKVMLE